jgi:hypothetical protein
MQQRLASSFENRDPRSRSSRRRSLRRVGALALLLCTYGMSAGGCSRQAEGERCDHAANGDEDCDEGLECVRPRGGAVDRCCPPAGAPIDDARCNGSDAPIATGGTAGSNNETGGTAGSEDTGGSDAGGSDTGGSDTGGTSTTGGMSTTGGADASGGVGGGDDLGEGGVVEPAGGSGGVPAAGAGGVPAAGAGGSSDEQEPATGGSNG